MVPNQFRSLLYLLLVLCLRSAESNAQAIRAPLNSGTGTNRYTILLSGQPAGLQTVTQTADGERQVFFEISERGRGQRITSRISVGANGIPTRVENAGYDYFKNPVAERYSLSGQTAAWKNSAEQGTRVVSSPAFYLSMTGTPEEVAILARVLLKSPDRKLSLLPEGEAHIERLSELKLETTGKTLTLTQYAISGLDFVTFPVWLDQDRNLFATTIFATASGCFSVIREGYESHQTALVKAQEHASEANSAALAKALGRRSATGLVIKHANLFDAETGKVRPDTTVVISGNRIRAVGPDGRVRIPPTAEVIDAHGRMLMPDMWDMHEHLEAINGMLDIAAGVTTVRDLGNDTDKLMGLRRRFDEGTAVGPRVLMAGLVEGRNRYAAATKVHVDTEEEARAAIDNYSRLGYVQIKMYSSIKPELVPKIVALAHARGLRVSGHVPAFTSAVQFVDAGVDEIQHVNFLFLNFMFDTVTETNTPLRFTAVAERGAELDLDSEPVASLIRSLKQHNVAIDSTVNAFEVLFTARTGSIPPSFASIADHLPAQVRRGMLVNSGLAVPEGKDQRFRDSFKALLKMIGLLHKSGVTLLAGTDWLSGFSYHRELELYAEAGIPAPAILQIATIGAARVMKRDSELGSIVPGKLADMVLVDGNPAARISDIRRVTLVIKDGVTFECASIYRAMGIRPLF